MKRFILVSLTVALSFSYSKGQDTIIFKDYPKPVICKIKNITADKINYYEAGDYYSVDLSNVKYHSKLNQQANTAQKTPNPAPAGKAGDIFKAKPYIALSIGPGFPFGNYSDSGFANTGINLSFSGAVPFEPSNFGFAFKIDYGYNPVNQTEFLSALKDGVGNPYASYSINSLGSFSYESVLLGICEMFPDENFCIEFRALGGLMFANTPAVNINVYENGGLIGTVSQQGASAAALCLNIGAGFRYYITDEISALVNFNLMYSDPQFSVTANAIGGGGGNTVSGSVNQVFEVGNLTFGVAWTPLAK